MRHATATLCGTICCILLAAGPSAALASDPADPGPLTAGWRTVTVSRPNTSTFSARLYYPATGTGGANASLDLSAAPYAAVSFGHGFLQPVDRYHSTLAHLATWGFLVIASESESGLFPSHSNFAADLSHCLTWLEQQHGQPGSFLAGALYVGAYGLSGHSMGGGASILAAAADPRIRAVSNLAAANTNPSAIAQMPNITVPISLIAGTSDSITPVQNHGQLMYNAGNSPRQLPLIQGGSHCGFQDVSSFGCDSGPLPRAQQLAITRRLMTSFFLLHLKQNESVWRLVWGPEAAADPLVQMVSDSGITVTHPLPHVEGFGARTVPAAVVVTNTASGQSEQYLIEVEGSAWPASVQPGPRLVIPPGRTRPATVEFAIPAGYPRLAEMAIVSARSPTTAVRAWTEVHIVRLCRADLDRNGILNNDDIIAMNTLFAQGNMDADINNDGILDMADFKAFAEAYAAGCE